MINPGPSHPNACRLLLGVTALLVLGFHVVQIIGSLDWPLVGDAALMHYIGWMIEEGAVPYRDAFDMNFPGTLVMHLTARAVFGPSDLGWRLFDLVATLGIAVLIYSIGRTSGRLTALAAALMFTVIHLASGPGNVGQRDLFVLLFLLTAARAALWSRADSTWPLASAGLAGSALGAAVMIKPVCAAFAIVVVIWLAMTLEGPRRVRALTICAAASLIVPLLLLSWLASTGGLRSFIDIVTNYLLPLYRGLASERPLYATLLWVAFAGSTALVVVTAFLARLQGRLTADRALLLAGVGYGLLHYTFQGKGWFYHLYPLTGACCALLATFGVAQLDTDRNRSVGYATWALLLAATLGFASLRGFATGHYAWRGLGPSSIVARKVARVDAITADVAPLIAAGDTVQVFDTARGGIHALLRLGVRQPTRFIYDFHFYHDVERPYIQALRHELMAGLEAVPPRLLLVLEYVFPSGEGYERTRRFPELQRWMERNYRLASVGDQYRVYLRVAP